MQKIKLTDLLPDRHNANKGTERGGYILDTSIEQFGAGRSILLDRDNEVIAGNKTLQALIDAGYDELLVVESDGKTAVAVKRTDMDLDDPSTGARGLAYADNRASEVGLAWDAEQLLADVQAGIDFETWFHEDELNALLEGLIEPEEPTHDPGAQVDRAEELNAVWQVERGQIWEVPSLNHPEIKHIIVCDDCSNQLLPEYSLCILDPIYGDDIETFLIKLKSKKMPILSIAWGFETARLVEILGAYDFDYVSEIGEGLHFGNKPIQRHKLIAYWGFDHSIYKHDVHLAKEFATSICFWQLRAKRSEVEMKYSKPSEQFAFFIDIHSDQGQIIFDPYLGSGTTLVACEQLGRVGYGMEIEPKYVAVTLQRLADMGLEPRLLSKIKQD